MVFSIYDGFIRTEQGAFVVPEVTIMRVQLNWINILSERLLQDIVMGSWGKRLKAKIKMMTK